MEFFTTSTRHLLTGARAAGVRHYVALSVVGTDRLPDSGYFRAKMAQETLIKESAIPYSIVHATQFFEFIGKIADAATRGREVRLPPVLIQPMAADDVAAAVAKIALGPPADDVVEIAGPEQFRMDEMVRRVLRMRNDPRVVISDPHARYWGIPDVDVRALVPGDGARLAETRLDQWLDRTGRGKMAA
jgi:uncharacterized protein YbjT (DUF2867 family)